VSVLGGEQQQSRGGGFEKKSSENNVGSRPVSGEQKQSRGGGFAKDTIGKRVRFRLGSETQEQLRSASFEAHRDGKRAPGCANSARRGGLRDGVFAFTAASISDEWPTCATIEREQLSQCTVYNTTAGSTHGAQGLSAASMPIADIVIHMPMMVRRQSLMMVFLLDPMGGLYLERVSTPTVFLIEN